MYQQHPHNRIHKSAKSIQQTDSKGHFIINTKAFQRNIVQQPKHQMTIAHSNSQINIYIFVNVIVANLRSTEVYIH